LLVGFPLHFSLEIHAKVQPSAIIHGGALAVLKAMRSASVQSLKKYPGRFQSMHLQDWSTTEKKDVAIGQGVVDWLS
jgi:hypothetical protein